MSEKLPLKPGIIFREIFIYFAFLFLSGSSAQSLSSYDFSAANADQIKLMSELTEISGLTVSDGEKLFAHADEKGNIYQLDPYKGIIVKKFRIGEKAVYSDFEGITFAGRKIFLVNSKGELFLFYEQKNGAYARYTKITTPLNVKNDVEGLCFDPSTYTLLLACKENPGERFKDFKAVYSFDIKGKKLNDEPRFLISLKELESRFNITKFSPSGIERDQESGSFFVLSSREKCIVQISPQGKIIDAVKLNHKLHKQPEGITFLNNALIICDEGGKGQSTLTRYKLK